jgi:hypothetical protein
MSAAHVGTFDAERWWRPEELAELPAAPGGVEADGMDELLAVCCEPGDLLVTRNPFDAGLREALAGGGIVFDHQTVAAPARTPIERHVQDDALVALARHRDLRPYAVLPDTAALARRLGLGERLPPPDVVARVNSKSWSNQLVRRLALPGAGRVVRSVRELTAAVQGVSVVKDPYGVSGRSMLEVRTPGVLAAIERVLGTQVSRGRRVELLVQPKFAKRTDFSGHLLITPDGGWERLGVQVMTNQGFRHTGSAPASAGFVQTLESGGYFDALAAVAGALAAAGYRGPAGVDSMVLADETIVPVLEVNARCSLGLLSLLLDRRVTGHGLRCHLEQLHLKVTPGQGVADLLAALRRFGRLYRDGAGPGILILNGSTLSAPGGRVYCALICAPGETAALRAALLAAATAAGMTPR